LSERLVECDERVVEVRLFGSLFRGEAVPGSDADILIVLDSHSEPRWFDRMPEFCEAFVGTDMPVDLFPYTKDELGQMIKSSTGLARAAEGGLILAERSGN